MGKDGGWVYRDPNHVMEETPGQEELDKVKIL